jgi:hypothetical protein
VRVDGAHDVEAVAVVSGNQDKSLLQAVGAVELGNGGLDGVVELEEFTKSTVVVEDVHHLINGSSLRHEEETLVAGAGLENVDGLKGHVLEAGLVESRGLVTSGRERLVQVLTVDVAIEPLGHVGGGEDSKSLLCVRGRKHGSAVLDDLVVRLGELIEVVLALVSDTTERRRVELFSATSEDDINGNVCPGVVLNTVKEGVDNCAVPLSEVSDVFKNKEGLNVLGTGTSVSNQSSGSRVGNIRSRHNSDVATSKTVEHLSNGLNLGVVKWTGAGIGIDVQAVDGALVSSVEGRSRVGRISDEAVNRVGHLVTEDGELVHGHSGLVLSVDGLVSDQACGRDHVGGHTIANEEDDILGLAFLDQVANKPSSLSLAAIVVVERSGVLPGLIDGNTTVRFRGDIHKRRLLCVPGEEVWHQISVLYISKFCFKLPTLVISKVPLLQLRVLNLEVFRCGLGCGTLLCDAEGEALIKWQSDGLGAVFRLMNLETDVKELARQKVGPGKCYLVFGTR